jgi:hypothetical protein
MYHYQCIYIYDNLYHLKFIFYKVLCCIIYRTLKNVLSTEMEERGYNLREPSGVLHLLETLVPILLECWMEATAAQHKTMEGR